MQVGHVVSQQSVLYSQCFIQFQNITPIYVFMKLTAVIIIHIELMFLNAIKLSSYNYVLENF